MKKIFKINSRCSILWLGLALTITACATDTKQEEATSDMNTEAAYYTEQHRPQFHFSPEKMWMNDPNGMVFYDDEYHLFYQYYPDSTVWGPMHWGHAISKDLVHWEHLPIALYPDSLGYIFSGSAVVDWNNTSGLGTEENPPLVAIFTYHDAEGAKEGRNNYQTQGIAYSLDKGRTWEKYADNPVLDNPGIKDFRDPKVAWHAATEKWVMILAVLDHVELYGSPDLKSWEKLSEFGEGTGAHGGVWECPDLFPLSVEGQDSQKWVMLVSINPGGLYGGSATQYFVGDFDGKEFINDNPDNMILWLDYGKDNYAGVTWSDIPEEDGRRIFMGWMSNWQYANKVPTSPWRSAMTIPRTLSLQNTSEGDRLVSNPVRELEFIRGDAVALTSQSIEGEVDITQNISFDMGTAELLLEFTAIQESEDFGIELSNANNQKITIGYESHENRFYIDRTEAGNSSFSPEFSGKYYAPRMSMDDALKLHLFIDVSSVELFADDGEVVMTELFFPDTVFDQIKLYAKDGKVTLQSGKAIDLHPIWKDKLALLTSKLER